MCNKHFFPVSQMPLNFAINAQPTELFLKYSKSIFLVVVSSLEMLGLISLSVTYLDYY